MPRTDPASGLGLISDVCLKRKVRNFVQLFPPGRNGKGYNILIQQGAVIETEQKKGIKATEKATEGDKRGHAERARDWLCGEFYDVRTFGQVVSTGDAVLKGSAFGQIRGPVQFTFGRSFHPVTPLEVTITRCAVTQESKANEGVERTMGQKYIVPYALYSAKCYVSPAFAEQTGFGDDDYGVLIDALTHLFDHDRSASRGEMVVRGLFDFEHVGTQGDVNPEQNRKEARLGCAHAHELFATVPVVLRDGVSLPVRFEDYAPIAVTEFDADGLSTSTRFKGVKLHRRVDPAR